MRELTSRLPWSRERIDRGTWGDIATRPLLAGDLDEAGLDDAFLPRIQRDAWLVPKLAVVLAAATPAVYAIRHAIRYENLGVALAIVPDALVAAGLLAFLLAGVIFLHDGRS